MLNISKYLILVINLFKLNSCVWYILSVYLCKLKCIFIIKCIKVQIKYKIPIHVKKNIHVVKLKLSFLYLNYMFSVHALYSDNVRMCNDFLYFIYFCMERYDCEEV